MARYHKKKAEKSLVESIIPGERLRLRDEPREDVAKTSFLYYKKIKIFS